MAKIYELSNGLKVITESIPFFKSVAFGIFVRNGSRNEVQGLNGISHLIEHMFFKGTEKRTALNIAEDSDSIGAAINAYTSKEHTCYYTRVIDEKFEEAVEIMSDMFFNSKFSDDDIIKERSVVLEEIGIYNDQASDLVINNLHKNVWKDSSLGQTILGTFDTLKDINKDVITDYLKDNYTISNTIISVAGNINDEDVINILEKYFSKWQNNSINQYNTVPKYHSSRVLTPKTIEQTHFVLSWEGLDLVDKNRYAMAIINICLGGGMSSRLFQRIREELGMVYSIYSYVSSFSDAGLFNIYSELSNKNIEEVYTNIIKITDDLKINKLSENTLNKLKSQLKSNIILAQESIGGIMSAMGRTYIFRAEYTSPDEIITKINSVTSEDVLAIANKVFNKDVSISIAGNTQGINIDKL